LCVTNSLNNNNNNTTAGRYGGINTVFQMDHKPFSQVPQQSPTVRFAVPSVQSSSLGSVAVPGAQTPQQAQRVLASASLQSPPQSALTPSYPTTTTPNQNVPVKIEPGLIPVADTSALTGTTVSIKDEMVTNTVSDIDQKPDLNSAVGGELMDVGNTSSSELDDGSGTAGMLGDVKPPPAKAPLAKKGELFV